MTRKLVLEARDAVPDGAGGSSGGWVPLGTHWGEVTLRSGRQERGEAGARSRVSYVVRVRAVGPDQPSRPLPGQRFRDGARVFLIRTVADARSGAAYLDCLTDEEMLP
ncbi:MAG: head-tail adaptor protein [Silicimonas sp.]|nr:head-tail adaptor protein [Silicimonas sp.]